jgi:hypothetical protein
MIVEQQLHDRLKKRCPNCRKYKLYQDLQGQHTFVYQEPKTLGHQAERNTERMSKYELEQKRSKEKKLKKRPQPWYNTEGKQLNKELSDLDTVDKQRKYIMEGK